LNSVNALLPFSSEPLFSFCCSKKIYKTEVLPVLLYGYETGYFTLMKGHRLNRVLRRIFGPKRDEVIGGWRNCIMSTS
jgi:hypothetical protein